MRTRSILGALGLAATISPHVCGQSLTWQPHPTFNERYLHRMAEDPLRGRVVLFGGSYYEGINDAWDTWEWDGSMWIPQQVPAIPQPRYSFAMAYDHARNTVLLFGGQEGITYQRLNDLWEWDGQQWREIPRIGAWPSGRTAHALGSDPLRRRVLLFGGFGGTPWSLLQDTWEWDGQQWTSLSPQTAPYYRSGQEMAYCGANGRIVMYGGVSFGGLLVVDPFFEWDGTDWLPHPTPGPGRNICDLISTPWNGRVVMRTETRLAPSGANAYSYLPETWEYDGTQWTQIPTSSWPGHRQFPCMAPDSSRQQALFFGGRFDGGWNPVQGELSRSPSPDPADTEGATWTYANGQWSREPLQPPVALEIVGAAPDPNRARSIVLVRVPAASPGYYDFQTWVHEDGGFRNLNLPFHPAYREQFAFQYHPGMDRWVMYGGMLGAYATGETWVFDGSAWVQDARTPSPPAATAGGCVMTYDPHRGSLVMKQTSRSEIWEYRASGWSQRVEATMSFTNRISRELVYDSTRRRLIATSFYDRALGWIRETWEFDGQSWSLNPTAGYPEANMSVLLDVPELGGVIGFPFDWPHPRPQGRAVNDPWMYDGVSWRRPATEFPLWNGIIDRQRPYPVYDRRLGRVRVFASTLAEFPTGSQVWDLVDRTLSPTTHQPRLGERLGFRLDAPRWPNTLAVIGISGGTWPGIDIGSGDGRAVPLANDTLFQISLGLALVVLMDGNGQGTVQLAPIPRDPALMDTQLHAAGAVLDPSTGWFGHVTNPVSIRVVP